MAEHMGAICRRKERSSISDTLRDTLHAEMLRGMELAPDKQFIHLQKGLTIILHVAE
jgi:hypothetical protein